MKLITLILASYIALLTAQPVLSVLASVLNLQSKECCANSSCEEGHNNKSANNHQHTICNPFLSCADCFGYFISENSFSILTIAQQKAALPVMKENVHSDYLSIFFQPPEIA